MRLGFLSLTLTERLWKNKKKKNEFQEKIQKLENQLFQMMEKEKFADEQITIYAIRKESEIFDSLK